LQAYWTLVSQDYKNVDKKSYGLVKHWWAGVRNILLVQAAGQKDQALGRLLEAFWQNAGKHMLGEVKGDFGVDGMPDFYDGVALNRGVALLNAFEKGKVLIGKGLGEDKRFLGLVQNLMVANALDDGMSTGRIEGLIGGYVESFPVG
jgi:hypothetical protein